MKFLKFLAVFTIISALFCACQKEESSDSNFPQQSESLMKGKFEKALALTDAFGKNQITVIVSSDDESFVSSITSDNFELQPLLEAYENAPEMPQTENRTAEPSKPRPTKTLHVSVTNENLEPNAKGIALGFKATSLNGVAVDIWFHNNSPSGFRNRRTLVYAEKNFYVAGVYTGFWPFWTKKYGNLWGIFHVTPSYYTDNLSVNITQVYSSPIYAYYWK